MTQVAISKRRIRTKREPVKEKPNYTFIGFRPSRLMNHRLRSLSRELGVPVSDLVRECVQEYIAKLAPANQTGGIPK